MTADTGADDSVADDREADSGPDGASGERTESRDVAEDSDPGDDSDPADPERVVDPEDVADADDVAALVDDLDGLRSDLDELETRIDEKTVHRDEIRAELRRYVRKRQRRGHATGWGPYLVLLYGTVMTVAAFYYLGDLWAIVAMFVVWTSTLGTYVFMLVVGAFLGVGRRVAGLRDLVGKLRG